MLQGDGYSQPFILDDKGVVLLCGYTEKMLGFCQSLTKKFIGVSEEKPFIWHWKPENNVDNFGDTLLYEIACKMAPVEKIYSCRQGLLQRRFIPGGSTLHHCQPGDIFWGGGLNDYRRFKLLGLYNEIDVRSVRGPLSADFVRYYLNRERPVVSSDPGLLAKEFYGHLRSQVSVEYECGIVQHYNDRFAVDATAEYLVIDPLRKPELVIKDILRCSRVVSSSLHGLIVADSFGIPSKWVLSDENKVSQFKYFDYYLSTNRTPNPSVGLHEALSAKPEELWVDNGQAALLKETFPWDIYA